MIAVMCRLPSVLCCVLSLAIFRAASFLVMSAMATLVLLSITALWTCSVLQLFILLHQLLYIGCQSLDLLSHHHKIWRWCWCGVRQATGALSVGVQWFEKESTRVPIDGAKLMKPKIDLVSMLLVNVDGRAPVHVVKKRKAKEVSLVWRQLRIL